MGELSLVAALATGVLALLSPCTALVLPAFFAYAFAGRRSLLTRTAAYGLGLSAVLVPLGVGVQSVTAALTLHRSLLVTVAGWVVIGLGVLLALGGARSMPYAAALQQHSARLGSVAREGGVLSWVATVALGAVHGLAGFCAGPALGAILTVAATSESRWQGGLLMLMHAAGMALPLALLALVWDHFDVGSRAWVRGRPVRLGPLTLHSSSLVGGMLLVAVGAMFLVFDGTATLGALLGAERADTLTGVEVGAQQWVVDHLGGVPVWVLPAVVAVLAALVAWRRSRD